MTTISDQKPIVTPPQVTKPQFCHRVYVQIPYAEQGLDQKLVPKGTLEMMACIKDKCAIWNDALKKCGNKVQSEAIQAIAELLKKQSGETKINGF